jgi:hypothetical protein
MRARASQLPPPPAGLAGFPGFRSSRASLYRIHRARRSPWWFSSDGSGRFDLAPASGRGTCYLAREPAGAFLEVFRFWVLVPEEEVRVRRIARLPVPPVLLADCTSGRSRAFGVTGEIHTTADYEMTQLWAAAFAAASFDGVRYLLRHDPGQRLNGVALFGAAGSPSGPQPGGVPIGRQLIAAMERRFGIRVLPTAGRSPSP